MPDRPARPRIGPVPPEDRDETVDELLGAVRVAGSEANVFTTLVRAPGLFRRWLPFGGKLLAGKLPARDRELLILRTAANCGSSYEWGQHVGIAAREGLSGREIERAGGVGKAGDSGHAILLAAADELHEDYCISDVTWSALEERYDTEQLIELLMLVGHYHLLAMTLNSLGVELDEGLPDLPSS